MRATDPERIYTPKPDETAGLSLWNHWNQQEAAPECARPVATAQMQGAKQAAREAIAPHLTKLQARVLAGITAYGGITRDRLAEVLHMNPNTLRPRIKELLNLRRIEVAGYTTQHPRRELLVVSTDAAPPAQGRAK